MFSFNWSTLRLLVPSFLRQTVLFAWLDLLHSQVIAQDGIFQDFSGTVFYKMSHNSQVIYFEKVINDKFDPVDRAIYIETVDDIDRFYVFKKAEAKPKRFMYRKWNSGTAYPLGDFSVDGLFVWKAKSANTNHQPSTSPIYWDQYKAKAYLYRKSEFDAGIDFIVWVPSSLTINTDQLKVMINYYKFADKRYTINTF